MKVSDHIAVFLRQQDVPCVFEMSGGMITFLLDSIHRTGGVKIVSVHHEQSAAFAVDAIARMTGRPGVAMATSGPGATNLLTGIGSCYFDSSPGLFITGQVNRHEQKGDRPIRQLGFQETDIVSMAKPITKAAWQVEDPDHLPEMLRAAFALTLEGRPGPVLLDIPMDVQRADVPAPNGTHICAASGAPIEIDPSRIRMLVEHLQTAQRPLVLVGGGIRSSCTADLARRFIQASALPTVHSLLGVDVLPSSSPYRVGMIGSYGNRWANLAMGEADLLLVLGSRLDIRQTGADIAGFKGDRVIFHVDVEPGEMNNRVEGCHTLHAHLREFFPAALNAIKSHPLPARDQWNERIQDLKREWPDTGELVGVSGINPNALMHELAAASTQAAAYVIDVGQHQMWAAQSIDIGKDQRFLTSGGMGSMGFALPAAIGAACATPGRPIVVVAGDGGFQSNIQELQTVVRNRMPLKIVVLNNGCHGMVRQFQQSYFHGRYQSTVWGYSAPDFAHVAAAYEIPAETIDREEQLPAALRRLFEDPAAPGLLHVRIDQEANAYPKIAFGHPMTQMEPFVKPLDMEGT